MDYTHKIKDNSWYDSLGALSVGTTTLLNNSVNGYWNSNIDDFDTSTNYFDGIGFTLTEASNFDIRLSWNGNSLQNLGLWIYDVQANDWLVGGRWDKDSSSNDALNAPYNSSIKLSYHEPLHAGQYWAAVIGYDGGYYDYQLRFSNDPAQSVSDTDGTFATAKALGSLKGGSTPDIGYNPDKIGGGDNYDYYKFHLDTQSKFAARLASNSTQPLLHIYNANQQEVSMVKESGSDPDHLFSSSVKVSSETLAAGDYYLLVDANGSAATDYGLRLSNTAIQTASTKGVALPYDSSKTHEVKQGYKGSFSHLVVEKGKIISAELQYGVDFNFKFGEPVLAMKSGTVVDLRESVVDGGSIALQRTDPSAGTSAIGNFITIQQDDGVYASYMHFQQNSIPVNVGQHISTGQVIGNVGNTGLRDGTHLHVNFGSKTINWGANGENIVADGQYDKSSPDYFNAAGNIDIVAGMHFTGDNQLIPL